MHMHATPCDGTFQQALIRKSFFMYESCGRAGLDEEET
jgi:hypothetical protein